MTRKKKPLPIIENVTIQDYAAEGKCIVRLNDLVVFVPFCVPGDIVDLQITRKKHSYAEAEIIRFVEYSKNRATPPCKHFGICGGCKWQNLPYEEQLRFKQEQIMQQLRRIGKIELPECSPILGSQKIWEYRNKLDFACSSKNWLTKEQMQEGVLFEPGIGFHISGAFDKVLHIKECLLMEKPNNEIRNFAYEYATEKGLSFFNLREQHGLLRDIIIRNSLSGEWMVTIQFGPNKQTTSQHFASKAEYNSWLELECSEMKNFDSEIAMDFLNSIKNKFPQISSLLWVYNPKCNDTFGDLDVHLFSGNDHIFELMEDLQFKVGPKSFYQTNTEQAHILYNVARDFAELTGKELVYDLYTGTGTIANFVAKNAKKVIGIEYVEDAIADANINSEINNISNTSFFAGDMKDILTDEFIAEHGKPDVLITDPPRAGMHPDVINVILNASPSRIVYVSCNPATQARDLQLLNQNYQVMAIQPVDMFPHTPHVENVVQLKRRGI